MTGVCKFYVFTCKCLIKKKKRKKIAVVMSMYDLIEYSDHYSKTSGSLWQYYRDEPALNVAEILVNFCWIKNKK